MCGVERKVYLLDLMLVFYMGKTEMRPNSFPSLFPLLKYLDSDSRFKIVRCPFVSEILRIGETFEKALEMTLIVLLWKKIYGICFKRVSNHLSPVLE